MSVDRILQCYIRNMTGSPSPLIENYLWEAGFWHVATIGRGCKLDLKLISALIERWRSGTYTFHLPCGECTITLEDVHLQLGLPVDGDVVTRSFHSADWGAVCYELLGAISDNINGGRIEMSWLRDTFPEPDDDSTELERIRYAQAYILEIIGGYLMLELSQNLVHLRWLLKLVDFRVASEFSWGSAVLATLYREMYGATRLNKAKIGGCLSLLQLWAWFRFPFLRPRVDHPYTFPLITSFNGHHTRIRQFERIDLQQLHTDWLRFWSHFIQMWEDRYDYIPTRELIIVPELACIPEYMPWFRIHGKPYLLLEEERRRQLRVQRERRGPLNPRRRDDDTVARGPVRELFFLPIPITLWVSNTFAIDDANTSTVTILSRWVILPTPTNRSLVGGTKIPAEATTTSAEAGQMRNPARNHRQPPYGTESDWHRD
ncbi:hypothetical protein J1N35_015089 [Gossypium stocksii]|uniref:Aminotransferase-like plant mobile domain-containing protein n=1 Tax=Gossypium stocksii TaxID=47602 RepID=A0A9D3VW23_9ROSI|nr:hypothetical protein J1N35_015089 [Gossypium stocksii]